MACHAAFELDLYRQLAVVFSHSLGRCQPVHARACACPLLGDLTLSVGSDLD